jgi:type II secretory pathway component PulK
MRPVTGAAAREEGVVLLLVLVVIVLCIGTVYAFTRTTTLEVLGTRHRTARAQADLLARSGLAIATRAILEDRAETDPLIQQLETPRDPWARLGLQPIDLPGGGRIRISVEDSGTRLNPNGLLDAEGAALPESPSYLEAVLARVVRDMPGRQEEKRYDPGELAHAILDWIDSDTQTARGDDEGPYYARLAGPGGRDALPLDRPLLSIAELADVPGMDALLLESLEAYLTPYPMFPDAQHRGVNPNTAPAHVLGLVQHGYSGAEAQQALFDEPLVFRILAARAEGRVFCASSGTDCAPLEEELPELSGETLFPPLQYASDVFLVRVEAEVGETRSCVTSVIDRSRGEAPRTLSYGMDC